MGNCQSLGNNKYINNSLQLILDVTCTPRKKYYWMVLEESEYYKYLIKGRNDVENCITIRFCNNSVFNTDSLIWLLSGLSSLRSIGTSVLVNWYLNTKYVQQFSWVWVCISIYFEESPVCCCYLEILPETVVGPPSLLWGIERMEFSWKSYHVVVEEAPPLNTLLNTEQWIISLRTIKFSNEGWNRIC